MIDGLVNTIASQLGIDATVARQGVGVVFALLQKFGESGAVSQLFDAIPGAADLASGQAASLDGGAGGGLMGMAGGLLGGSAGDAAKALGALQGLGRDMDQSKQLASLVGGFIKDNGGAGALDGVLGDAGWLKALL